MMQDKEKKKVGETSFYFICGLNSRNTYKHAGEENGWGFLGTPGIQCEPVERTLGDKAGMGERQIL